MKFIFYTTTLAIFSVLLFACNQQTPSSNTESATPATEKIDSSLLSIDALDFYKLTSKNPNLPILDFRTEGEFKNGHIHRSTNMPYTDPLVLNRLASLGREQAYAVYCMNGNISLDMAKKMQELGFKHIYHLQNGLMTWGVTSQPLIGGAK
jgi:rhodanese-related sulfurtransferase